LADDALARLIRRHLRDLGPEGIHATSVVVFGSFARGDARQWSDIDLIVVSPHFDGPLSEREVETLWIVAGRVDSRIEPVPCGERQWLDDDHSPIVEVGRPARGPAHRSRSRGRCSPASRSLSGWSRITEGSAMCGPGGWQELPGEGLRPIAKSDSCSVGPPLTACCSWRPHSCCSSRRREVGTAPVLLGEIAALWYILDLCGSTRTREKRGRTSSSTGSHSSWRSRPSTTRDVAPYQCAPGQPARAATL